MDSLREVEKRTIVKEDPKKSNKQSYDDQKKLKSLNNRLSKVESQISQLEKKIKEIDVELAVNYEVVIATPNFYEDYQAKKEKLSKLMEDWEAIHEDLDKL